MDMDKNNNINTKTGFKIDEICISFIVKREFLFYTAILSRINKTPTKHIPTMGVGFNKNGKLELFYNPNFLEKQNLRGGQAVLEHEILHIFNRHFSRFKIQHLINNDKDPLAKHSKQKELKKINIACDIAINQYIKHIDEIVDKNGKKIECYLPITFNFKEKESAEYYLSKLNELEKNNPDEYKKILGNCEQLDDHDLWDKVVEDAQLGKISSVQEHDIDVDHEIRSVIRKAISDIGNNYGSLPDFIKKEIEKFNTKPKYPWKNELRIFANTVLTNKTRRSQKRMDRRFFNWDYIPPGHKKNRRPKLIYARDTSGSMFNEKIQKEILNELLILSKRADIIVLDVDTKIKNETKLKKSNSKSILLNYKGGGGTCFKAVFKRAMDLKVDGIIYATDLCGTFPKSDSEIGKYSNRTIWLTFNNNNNNTPPFGRHVNIDK